ncbi:DNA repair protein XRCC1 [Eurosta solidaginis]|uniref:DNA repair protein XRCC1 n=1 Tax=Eurosta solidaginis TaxID=178769 RepID=UPI003530DE35
MITGIDIGNEFSAFVEVLVGKTSSTNNFTEILVTCSFMTPIESKNSTNPNRVRCFNKESLVPTAACEKWKFIKIICTQPFNKHIQYGISFIKIHVAESEHENSKKSFANDIKVEDSNTSLNFSQLGKFKLREESPDSDSESSTSLFKRWKASERSHEQNLKHDATASTSGVSSHRNIAIMDDAQQQQHAHLVGSSAAVSTSIKLGRSGNKAEENDKPLLKQKNPIDVLDRNREDLAFGNDDVSDNQEVNKKRRKLLESIELERQQLRLQAEKTKDRNEPKKAKGNAAQNECKTSTKKRFEEMVRSEPVNNMPTLPNNEKTAPSQKCSTQNESNMTSNASTNVITGVFRPFNQLLKGTILVISGIQNPERSNLRDKALAMGAKYRADWESGCTHLICAFKNTPKYNQVKGKGKIVTRAWVEDCYRQKKKLPWRRYALDSSDLNQPDSEDEILDESLRPVEATSINDIHKKADSSVAYSNSNDVKSFIVTSGSDTEDEIQKVLKNNNSSQDQRNGKNTTKRTVFDVTTEEEEFLAKKAKLNTTSKNGGFFKGVKFFICDDIKPAEWKRLENLLQINGGSIMSDENEAKYLITNGQTTSKSSSTDRMLVKPDWIYECNDMEIEVSIKKFLL